MGGILWGEEVDHEGAKGRERREARRREAFFVSFVLRILRGPSRLRDPNFSTTLHKERRMGHTFEKLSYTVFGACIAVQRQLGPHCMEMDYQRALALELSKRGLEFIREAEIPSTTTESKSLAGGSTS
jgi:hypothetical protein